MTGLFGGLDMGTAAIRNERVLRADLELRRSAGKTSGRWEEYQYDGVADLLLQHGQFYAGRQIPERYAHLMGEESMCFHNAAQAAMEEPSLRYCEGCYWTGYGFASSHAWCVDEDGALVEVTLPTDPETVRRMCFRGHGPHDGTLPALNPEHWGYFGVLLTPELAFAHFEKFDSYAPMFDRSPGEMATARVDLTSPHDFPLLKVPYDPQRTTLP